LDRLKRIEEENRKYMVELDSLKSKRKYLEQDEEDDM
jgi:hypothetical protein